MSLYQALVLLLFNERDSVAFGDIGRLTGMEDKDLRLTLLSLSMGKQGAWGRCSVGVWAGVCAVVTLCFVVCVFVTVCRHAGVEEDAAGGGGGGR